MTPESSGANADEARLRRQWERERAARLEAESIAERATRALYDQHSKLQLLETMAVAANEAGTVEEALRVAVDRICIHSGWPIGHAYLLNDEGQLVSTRIWHLARPERFQNFRTVTESMKFPSGIGLPGRVLKSGRSAWMIDAMTDPNFPRAQTVNDLGFKSGFAFPILVATKVAGVLEFFCERTLEPNEEMLEIMNYVGAQLGRVVERQRARESLERREEFFRRITENTLDIVTILDAAGTIRYGSPSIQRLLGYTMGEYDGKKLIEFVHPDDVPNVSFALAEATARKGNTRMVVFRFRHQEGTWRVFEGLGNNLMDDPVVAGIVFNSRDITERKKLEEQFLQSQKMQAIGQLAGGVAHDFNNILTAIINYNELMLRRLTPGNRLHSEALEVRKAADRAATLTRQLLAFSRKQILEPRILDLNAIVAGLEKMLRPLVGEHIEVRFEPESELGSVRADPGQVEQVIVNLAVNARDAMLKGGNLTIATRNTVLDSEYARWHPDVIPGDYVLLSVSDNGTGMTPQIKARLFEPFFTTKEVGKGTGLGLATCMGIVKQSGGHMTVYSEPGQGTTFKVYLPRVSKDTDLTIPREELQVFPTGSELVLIVEDDEMVRDVGAFVLRQLGYRVLEVSNGVDALPLLQADSGVQLVITDVVMPQMGGKELLAEIRKIAPTVRVMFTSGYTEDAVVHGGMLEPGLLFLQKPYTVATLSRKVREALDAPV